MKRLSYILTIVILLLHSTACNDDFLDLQPLDRFAESAVWTDPALIETFVNNIYFGIPHGFSNQMMASLTDESMYNADFGSSNVTRSLVTPTDYYTWDLDWTAQGYRGRTWNFLYKYIRSTNVFLSKIDEAPFGADETSWKERMKGEVYFLRAYHYHLLVEMYGGVPIIDKAYTLDDDFLVHRNTYEECINFIVADLDKAAALLPVNHPSLHKGRATKGAALALKSRVLLHAASDMHHNFAWTSGFSKPELVGYTSGSQQARYQAAKAAAKAVIDLGAYSMYKAEPGPNDSTALNYSEIFLMKENPEDIFIRFFIQRTDADWDGYNPGLYNNPNGYHGWGSNTPNGQLVDDYEMKDGSRFDWNNPVHAANPYANRDPRFYATILYNGAKWRQRPSDVIGMDPVGIIQTGFWERWNATTNQMVEVPGLDTRKSPIEDWNGTYTSYYLRKFIDPTIDAQYFKQDLPWRFIRYTEIILNYAEACLELGEEAEARLYINMVRRRAGMPEINDSGVALRARYRNERRIELAYEDHRYYDVRRWLIAHQTMGNVQGLEIRYKLLPGNITSTMPTYTRIEVQDRAWHNRAYLLPIRLDEMNRNNNLIQNPNF
ncbi:MAG: RagB/SusD family nutrient uptake outer membrane protein [Cyclobacteriaceae bacterium]|nr:RagB/SusD family nutrient uptake outer membrane protein [Cyclobacteriaceae bacterium]